MASFLISDVRIFDGQSTIDCGHVLVRRGMIEQVSDQCPDFDGHIIRRPGCTLLPGLIDCHIHADSGNEVALPQLYRFGVTTVCDMHNEYENVEKLRKQMREDPDCADLKEASFAATVDMGWPMPVVLAHSQNPHVKEELAMWPKLKSPADAKQYIEDRVREGVDYIKLMHESGKVFGQQFAMPSIELQEALIEEAHKAGLITVAHALCVEDAIAILEAGVDGMTHISVDEPPSKLLIDAYKRNNAHSNPTLAALGSLTTEGKEMQHRFAHDPRVVERLVDANAQDRMCACMSMAKVSGASVEHAYEAVRQLKAAKIDIVLGSDAAGPAVGTAWGASCHQELALFVDKCGFAPSEALAAGTSVAARRFRFTDRGMIAPGLRADLLLVEGDPTKKIDDLLNIRGVWKHGVLNTFYADRV